jgi:flagellar hook-length control protein FliK
MLNSVREKSGDPLSTEKPSEDAGRKNADSRQEEKSLAERLPAPAPEKKTESSQGPAKPEQDALDRLLQRIDTAGAATVQGTRDPGAARQAPTQDLNNLARNFRQEIFSQVENGFLQQAQEGSQQLTLRLNPQDLGQITLILSVHQGELKAHIRTENGETAAVLTEQLAELKASLEAQGLKVKELDVQTQMHNNDFTGQWNGAREHNLMQNAQERARLIRLSHLRREADGAASAKPVRELNEQTGLHIVA